MATINQERENIRNVPRDMRSIAKKLLIECKKEEARNEYEKVPILRGFKFVKQPLT